MTQEKFNKVQKFDILMIVPTMICYLFPWMETDGNWYNIPKYIVACLQGQGIVQMYHQIFGGFAQGTKNIGQTGMLIKTAAFGFFVACFIVTVSILLNVVYFAYAWKKKKLGIVWKFPLVVIDLVVIQGFSTEYISGGTNEAQARVVVPIKLCIYLIVWLILEVVWIVGRRMMEELLAVEEKIEEERRTEEIRRQEILESYIGNLERMIDEMRAFQHDYKNMLSTMAGFLKENQIEELKQFFYKEIKLPQGSIDEQRTAWRYLKNIYPMELKGFLYEKVLTILAKNINIKVQSPENVHVLYNDMEALIRILGIYIDNAVEEAERLETGEIALIIVSTKKGVLFSIENNYEDRPDMSVMEQKGYSTKGENRGMGLYIAQQILREHEDIMHELQITEKTVVQQVEVILDK